MGKGRIRNEAGWEMDPTWLKERMYEIQYKKDHPTSEQPVVDSIGDHVGVGYPESETLG
jgi:hypothetical protein